jgi:hydroxymethylpyrimidine pyrophosphatase-like HAD family hydrolase
MSVIKLVAIDIDGCITPGEGCAADIDALGCLRDFNDRAAADPCVPQITLCTGRQQPFVDLMCQIIGARWPAIFENGAGLHFPDPYDFQFHPAATPERLADLTKLRALIIDNMVATGRTRIQPGKEVSLSVYPTENFSVEQNADDLRDIMRGHGLEFELDVSLRCVNILIPGLDKAAGFRHLAATLGLETGQMGAIGDAPGDLGYLELAGFPGVPANAVPELKAVARYVSPFEFGRGSVDIVEHIIQHNQNQCNISAK